MPWQGNAEISIDRFDVRAHLDYIAEVQIEENTYSEVSIMPCYVCSVPISFCFSTLDNVRNYRNFLFKP